MLALRLSIGEAGVNQIYYVWGLKGESRVSHE